MSTIGHPLSDLSNLLNPFTSATSKKAIESGRANTQFQPGNVPGLPTKEECIAWYKEAAGWDPTPDITWGDAFGYYRSSIIMQGIAARYALRQASSAKASEYGAQMKPFSEIAWSMVLEAKNQLKARL